MKNLYLILLLLSCNICTAQTNIHTTKTLTTEILKGDYTSAAKEIAIPSEIAKLLVDEINTDSLRNYLEVLETFETRNTGSDTLSTTRGIGAARTWIYDKLEAFNIQNGNSSVVDYLAFDQNICSMGQHKNVLLVHPGIVSTEGVIIIEAHMDSRCEDGCDVDCFAAGIEDNGSGVALVMELARVMTKKFYNKTLVFMLTTGEEQGLQGAAAMAEFCTTEDVNIKAVLNNDVIGGILCGETASPPGCPGPGHVDSTQVRLFSNGSTLSPHKGMARFSKLQYEEELAPIMETPMLISIMSAEDRTGRGGDHIPFRQRNFTAVRYTSANENGDAGITDDYVDHQHSTRDVLGLDTDNDGVLDSLFVDVNYLKRNACINGITAGVVAINPEAPEIALEQIGDFVRIQITSDDPFEHYKIGVRGQGNDFDSLYTIMDTKELIVPAPDANSFFIVSACVVNQVGAESCFSEEQFVLISATEELQIERQQKVHLMQNRPNPFDEATTIGWHVDGSIDYDEAEIIITDQLGRILNRKEIELNQGFNEWVFRHGWGTEGIYFYSLFIDGSLIETKSMIFAY